jgi:hypothetical protein
MGKLELLRIILVLLKLGNVFSWVSELSITPFWFKSRLTL